MTPKANQVQATVDRHWIRGPSDRRAIAEGCYFDATAGEKVCRFVELFCKQSKAKWAGQPIVLIEWQRDLIMRLYGWRRADGTRRFRSCYVEIPKKNGKSTLVSALVLYHLVADGERGAEIYCLAADTKQARIVFDEAARMVRSSPELARYLSVIPSSKTILYPGAESKAEARSADAPSADGVSASLTVFDELHRQYGRQLWDVYKYAGAAREQPLRLSITTAGIDRQSVCWEEHEYSRKVNEGTVPETAHLGIIYAADPDDDIDDPKTWSKANPSLGVTIKEEDFARELAEAKAKPSTLANFKRLRLNLWGQAADGFLSADIWYRGNAETDPDDLLGQPCRCGLDLASTTDLAAFAATFQRDGVPGLDVRMKFWMPEEDLDRKSERDGVDYRRWADEGLITLTPGPVVDYDMIRADIVAFSEEHPIEFLGADPWNATQLCSQLRNVDGLPVEFIRQGFASLSGPTKALEHLAIAGEIRHAGHPVLAYCIANAVAVKDANGNLRLDKSKSSGHIDGAAALVNALVGTLDVQAVEEEPEILSLDF